MMTSAIFGKAGVKTWGEGGRQFLVVLVILASFMYGSMSEMYIYICAKIKKLFKKKKN